jgi:hypothetical protein
MTAIADCRLQIGDLRFGSSIAISGKSAIADLQSAICNRLFFMEVA